MGVQVLLSTWAILPTNYNTIQHKKLGNSVLPRPFSPKWSVHMPRASLPNSAAVGTAGEGYSPSRIWSLVRLATESHPTLRAQGFTVLRKKLNALTYLLRPSIVQGCCSASNAATLAALIAASQNSSCSPMLDYMSPRLTSIIQWSSSSKPASPSSVCSSIPC